MLSEIEIFNFFVSDHLKQNTTFFVLTVLNFDTDMDIASLQTTKITIHHSCTTLITLTIKPWP